MDFEEIPYSSIYNELQTEKSDFLEINFSNNETQEKVKSEVSINQYFLQLKAYKSLLLKEAAPLYLIAGIMGSDFEAIYILEKITKWMNSQFTLELPIIIIPIWNLSGHQYGIKNTSFGVDLDKAFHINFEKELPLIDRHAEIHFMQRLLKKYPPKLIFTFRSVSHLQDQPLISSTTSVIELANYFQKYNNYSIKRWIYKENEGNLESMIYSKYKSEIISFHFPKANRSLSFQDIWLKNEKAFCNFFTGQRYF